jgi:hypothetical protein
VVAKVRQMSSDGTQIMVEANTEALLNQ